MEIKIRHSENSDIAAIKRIYEQPSCYAGTLQLPFPSEDLWQKRLGNIAGNYYSLIAVVDGEVAGQIGLEVHKRPRRKHAATIGMAVSERYQRKGVGSTLLQAALMLANNWLAVSRIELEVYTDNAAGLALYRKQGFEIEGEARDYAFRNGQYVNIYHMAKVSTR